MAAAGFQTSSRPTGVPLRNDVEKYSQQFRQTTSRKGRSRLLRVEEDNDWYVTLWVGEGQGKPRACVFAPWKSSKSGWEKAGEELLIDHLCSSEDEAFEHLQRAEHSGEIKRLAREAIKDYEPPPRYSGDIPF